MVLAPNAEDATLLDMTFFYNGESLQTATCQNPFKGTIDSESCFIGFHTAVTAESYVVVKTCDVTFDAE
jgi:hypothetical protein